MDIDYGCTQRSALRYYMGMGPMEIARGEGGGRRKENKTEKWGGREGEGSKGGGWGTLLVGSYIGLGVNR